MATVSMISRPVRLGPLILKGRSNGLIGHNNRPRKSRILFPDGSAVISSNFIPGIGMCSFCHICVGFSLEFYQTLMPSWMYSPLGSLDSELLVSWTMKITNDALFCPQK